MNDKRLELLHAGFQGGSLDIVCQLIQVYKLDPESQDKDGITCLHLVAS